MTHPSPTALEEISGALDALRTNQRQLDQDGVFVGVSRQALDEVLTHIAALEAELKAAIKERDYWYKEVGIKREGEHKKLAAEVVSMLKAEEEASKYKGFGGGR